MFQFVVLCSVKVLRKSAPVISSLLLVIAAVILLTFIRLICRSQVPLVNLNVVDQRHWLVELLHRR